MAIRDLDRLAKRVKAHRLELFPSRVAAAAAAGISKDTWRRVEDGKDVLEVKYAQIDRALGWATNSCIAITEGGEPILVDAPGGADAVAQSVQSGGLSAGAVRRAAFEAARAKLPHAPIGDIDAFGDEIVEVLRRAGAKLEGD